MKKYSKKKSQPNQPGPGFRTRRDFKVKKSMFDQKNAPKSTPKGINPTPATTFRTTQHRG